MPKYAELVYYGFWFTPEREMLQAAIDKSQEFVTGSVKLKLYKGNVTVIGRESKYSLYDQELGDFRGGRGGVRPPRRRRLYQAQRFALAHARSAAAQVEA